jgi:hypothetical protein
MSAADRAAIRRELERLKAELAEMRSVRVSTPPAAARRAGHARLHAKPSGPDVGCLAPSRVHEAGSSRVDVLGGLFADRYTYNPYKLALALKYAMWLLKRSDRLDDADLHALAEAAAAIIDHAFAAEFGEAAFSNPNAVHFPDFGI